MQQRRKVAQITNIKIIFSQLVYLFVGDKRYTNLNVNILIHSIQTILLKYLKPLYTLSGSGNSLCKMFTTQARITRLIPSYESSW